MAGAKADLADVPGDNTDRIVRGEFLSRLLRGQIAAASAGLGNARFVLGGARITGPVDLAFARIDRPLAFVTGCHFEAGLTASGARFRALRFDGSRVTGSEICKYLI